MAIKLSQLDPLVLVLGSSGFASYAQLGALWFLSYTHLLRNVKTYVGCSVGAIISLLLASGYQPLEVINDDKVLASLIEYIQGIKPAQLTTLVTQSGLLTLDPLKDYLTKKMTTKFGFVPTMKQLYDLRGCELVTVAVNVAKNQTVYLSRDNHPALSVVEAVLLSVNFPLLVQKYTLEGDPYIDGSFGNPYPVDYMDDGDIHILGITVVDAPSPCDSLITYLYRSIRHPIEEIRTRIIDNSSDKCFHLILTVEGGKTTGEVLLSGMDQAKRYYSS